MSELPAVVRDRGSQENFDALNKRIVSTTELEEDVEGLEGKFPVAAADLSSGAKELFLQLATAANRKIAFGSSSLSWTASTESAAKEITHGLGAEPAVVLIQLNAGVVSSTNVSAKSSTKFTLKGFLSGSFTTSINFDWIALG